MRQFPFSKSYNRNEATSKVCSFPRVRNNCITIEILPRYLPGVISVIIKIPIGKLTPIMNPYKNLINSIIL